MEPVKEKIVDLFSESKITAVEYKVLLKNLKELSALVKEHKVADFDSDSFMYLCNLLVAKNKYSFQSEYEPFKGYMSEEQFYVSVWRSIATIRSAENDTIRIMLCDLCRLCDLPKFMDYVEDLSVSTLLENQLDTDLFNKLCEVLTEEGIPYESNKDVTGCIPEISEVRQMFLTSVAAKDDMDAIYEELKSAVFRGETIVPLSDVKVRDMDILRDDGFLVKEAENGQCCVIMPECKRHMGCSEDELAERLESHDAAIYASVAIYCRDVLIPRQLSELSRTVATMLNDLEGKAFISLQVAQTRTNVYQRLMQVLIGKGYAVRLSDAEDVLEIGGWLNERDA